LQRVAKRDSGHAHNVPVLFSPRKTARGAQGSGAQGDSIHRIG
jgi:hypothetical protein